MNSIEDLMGMILQDAIESGGEPQNHYFDKAKNKEFIQQPPEYLKLKQEPELPPINYRLELIEKPDGTLEWVE